MDSKIALIDIYNISGDILLGWSMPADKVEDFLKRVDEVAVAVGGVPFSVMLGFEEDIPASEVNRVLANRGNAIIEEAERIISGEEKGD